MVIRIKISNCIPVIDNWGATGGVYKVPTVLTTWKQKCCEEIDSNRTTRQIWMILKNKNYLQQGCLTCKKQKRAVRTKTCCKGAITMSRWLNGVQKQFYFLIREYRLRPVDRHVGGSKQCRTSTSRNKIEACTKTIEVRQWITQCFANERSVGTNGDSLIETKQSFSNDVMSIFSRYQAWQYEKRYDGALPTRWINKFPEQGFGNFMASYQYNDSHLCSKNSLGTGRWFTPILRKPTLHTAERQYYLKYKITTSFVVT